MFLRLGLTSFGGPVAHLGYFRMEFVARRQWLDDQRYSDLVALCQFLPGPASSQVGIAIGLGRAGWGGAVAAWVGFTLPSALALILFAIGVGKWGDLAGSGVLQGLKAAAVAVVAQAVWGMYRSLCPDWPRAAIAVLAALLALAVPSVTGQLAAIGLGAVVGQVALRPGALPPAMHREVGVSRATGAMLLALFAALLFILPALAAATSSLWLDAVSVFYRAGALVFGGGHVVLPLLQAGVVPPGWVGNDAFLAGYGATQAVPGPLFTFAAYLGARMAWPMDPGPAMPWIGGLTMLIAIFTPAFLLVCGALPFWETLRRRAAARRVIAGINAAVVGLLAAAFWDPVLTSGVHGIAQAVLALAAFGMLAWGRVSPVIVVGLAALGGWAISIFGLG